MNTMTRAAAAVAVAAFVWGAANGFAFDSAVDEAVRWLPRDTDAVLVIDVRGLVGSPLYQRIRHDAETFGRHEDDFAAMTRETGIDPEKDIDGIVVAASLEGNEPPHKGLLVVSGRFDEKRIRELCRRRSVKTVAHEGMTIYQLEDKGRGDDGVFVLLDDRTVAFGAMDAVDDYLAARRGEREGLAAAEEMTALLDGVRKKGQIWGVVKLAAVSAQLPADLETLKHPGLSGLESLKCVRYVAGSAFVGNGVELDVSFTASNVEDAVNLIDVFRGIVALARLSGGGNPPADLNAFLDEIELGQSGTLVEVSMRVPQDLIERRLDKR